VHAVCTSDTSPAICGDVEHFAMCADFCLVKTICTRIIEIEFFFRIVIRSILACFVVCGVCYSTAFSF